MSLFRIVVNLFHFNRTNWKAVALCFLAATVFWLFNALNKTYSTLLRFPIRFEYDQTLFAAAAPLPENVPLHVSGNGWDLFRKTFGVKLPTLSLPLERPTEVKRIVASSLPPLFAGQLGNLIINSVATDTLRMKIDRRAVRRFKLVADLSQIKYREKVGRTSPVVVLPDSIVLDGPESLIKKIPDSIIVKLPAGRLNANYREEVEVQVENSEFIKRDPPVVEVMFEVNEMIERTEKIKIAMTKLPWGVTLENDGVVCRFLLPKQEAEALDPSMLRAVVSLNEVPQKRGEVKSFLPTVHGLSPYAVLLAVDSVHLKKH